MNAKIKNNISLIKKNSRGKTKVIVNGKLRCSKCGYLFDLSEFHKDKYSSTGYKSDCKGCGKGYKLKNKLQKTKASVVSIYINECGHKKCKKRFITRVLKKVFCSAKCRQADYRERKNMKTSNKIGE